ncbi:DUF429 domain-containing protein [Bdellovibrionota bacterium FG-1]
MGETRHYLGIELAGAKNQKTALAALEYFPKENKVFLLDIYDRLTTHGAHQNMITAGDEALVELMNELAGAQEPKTVRVGINAPLALPPCISCTRKNCPQPAHCTVPSVKWMRETARKAAKTFRKEGDRVRVLEFTPYTQRPVELWIRYHVLPKLPLSHRFEIDETLGGTKAPLTARMHFLRHHLGPFPLYEVWPKLTLALLALELELSRRVIESYRRLEEGSHAREQILETLSKRHDIFIYERDIRKLSQSLPAFDAFLCAYTALLADNHRCAKMPTGFPISTGWVQYPQC